MSHRSDLRLTLSALLMSCFFFVACDARHDEEQPAAPDPTEEPADPNASLEDAEVTPATNCGGADQACCGNQRAESLKKLAKRCHARRHVCPQSESSDICEPCGEAFQHCCLEKSGKAKCFDGSKCQRTGAGGPGIPAYPGMCLPEE